MSGKSGACLPACSRACGKAWHLCELAPLCMIKCTLVCPNKGPTGLMCAAHLCRRSCCCAGRPTQVVPPPMWGPAVLPTSATPSAAAAQDAVPRWRPR